MLLAECPEKNKDFALKRAEKKAFLLKNGGKLAMEFNDDAEQLGRIRYSASSLEQKTYAEHGKVLNKLEAYLHMPKNDPEKDPLLFEIMTLNPVVVGLQMSWLNQKIYYDYTAACRLHFEPYGTTVDEFMRLIPELLEQGYTTLEEGSRLEDEPRTMISDVSGRILAMAAVKHIMLQNASELSDMLSVEYCMPLNGKTPEQQRIFC